MELSSKRIRARILLVCIIVALASCFSLDSRKPTLLIAHSSGRHHSSNLSMPDHPMPPELTPIDAKQLAELMCRQLPNVTTILEYVRVDTAGVPLPPPQEPMVTDDVYDTLVRLGPYSLSCLIDRLSDTRWMPDPRSEPLLGGPVVGDVAYMILGDKGVDDLLPSLAHKKAQDLRMDYWFLWPSIGNHRRRLQNAVREWVAEHLDCCGKPPTLRSTAPTTLKSKMSGDLVQKTRIEFSSLHPGMSSAEVLRIMGKPDAIDTNDGNPQHPDIDLLGICANDRNEHTAYIYFTERWADEIAKRDPLRDRYLIAFFSGEDKLTRIFSNVAAIPPVFPSNGKLWERLIWGEPKKIS
jgi:hypothetical protein